MGELNGPDMNKTIVNVADFGVIADGETDCTAMLNECLKWTKSQGYSHVWLPSGTYLIDPTYEGDAFQPFRNAGIRVPSDIYIEMASDAVLKAKPNDSWGYSVIYIGKERNITITGGRIEGDRDEHVYKPTPSSRMTHEWGFGICIEGASNVNLMGIQIEKCTGDGVIIGPQGVLTSNTNAYTPSTSIKVSSCTIAESRRNNISITGCDGVIIEDCLIEKAGIGGVEPRMGIDIEGYGEGNIDLEEPLNITIRNNIVRGGAASSIYNYNGYGVVIEGNQTDSSISYGFGTETIISNNLICARGLGVTRAGIASLGVSLSKEENDVIIIGNIIHGFQTGIDVRGDSVQIIGNKISRFENAAILVYLANRILIEGNHIETGKNGELRSAALKVFQSDSVVFSGNTVHFVVDVAIIRGTHILIQHNQFKSFSRGIWVQDGKVDMNGNHFIQEKQPDVVPSYPISITGTAKAFIRQNSFKDYHNYAIYSTTTAPIDISANTFEESSVFVVIYVKNGSPQIGDNRFYLNRPLGQPISIYIDEGKGARVMRNNIINASPKIAVGIRTISSIGSVVAHNILERSQMITHANDVLVGNIEIPSP
ncbi:right-handed parallel beta-helix repeat-containing protein [Bacillus sp. NPDC077027]|uniref:right-handed parallel beta-helix repeat-containing protein n=1 Tax=Bacillus sp. NPDC077027 TaxID=3390548 RepID=UPI003D078F73